MSHWYASSCRVKSCTWNHWWSLRCPVMLLPSTPSYPPSLKAVIPLSSDVCASGNMAKGQFRQDLLCIAVTLLLGDLSCLFRLLSRHNTHKHISNQYNSRHNLCNPVYCSVTCVQYLTSPRWSVQGCYPCILRKGKCTVYYQHDYELLCYEDRHVKIQYLATPSK